MHAIWKTSNYLNIFFFLMQPAQDISVATPARGGDRHAVMIRESPNRQDFRRTLSYRNVTYLELDRRNSKKNRENP